MWNCDLKYKKQTGVIQNNSVLQKRRGGTKEAVILLFIPKKSEKESVHNSELMFVLE